MSTALSHTRLTKRTSLIHSHTLAYCQATRSHSMHALAVVHSCTLTHTHHDRMSRVGSGSVLREECACAVATTSSLLLLSCGKRPVRGCEGVRGWERVCEIGKNLASTPFYQSVLPLLLRLSAHLFASAVLPSLPDMRLSQHVYLIV